MKRRVLVTFSVMCLLGSRASCDDEVSFRRDIAPILLDNCLACHGARKAEGGYRVDSYEELFKAGDSGEKPIVTESDQISEVLRRITSDDEYERMPADSEPLAVEQIELVRNWIAGGAKFDGDRPAESLSLVIPPPQYADPPASYVRPIPIVAIAFSPDAGHVLIGGYHEVTVWDIRDARLVRRIGNLGQRIFALAFSGDGETLAVGCGEPGRSGEVRLVDFATGEVTGVVARAGDVVLDIAFRPETDELAVALADSTIRIVNTRTLKQVRKIGSHADWVTAVAWSDDGTRLASASRDKSAKVYDGSSGELLASYLGHGAAVRGVTILSDSLQVVSVGADEKLHRWNIEGAKKVAEIALGGMGHRLLRNGNEVFVPCVDQRLLRIDLNNNTVSQEYTGHNDWVLSAAHVPAASSEDGEPILISGSFDGEVRLWDAAAGTLVRKWTAKP